MQAGYKMVSSRWFSVKMYINVHGKNRYIKLILVVSLGGGVSNMTLNFFFVLIFYNWPTENWMAPDDKGIQNLKKKHYLEL